MQRDPSLHIKRSDLMPILAEYGLTEKDVNVIMRKASKYNLLNRVIVTAPAKVRKQIERTMAAEEGVTDIFNKVYNALTLEHHIKTLPIKKSDREYLTLKEISHQAMEFCRLFEIEDYEAGFKSYISIGIFLLNRKFSIYRLKAYSTKIVEYYGNMDLVESDPTPEETKKLYDTWRTTMLRKFGQDIKVTNMNQYVHFVHAKNDIVSRKADPVMWIEAQFDKWAFLNSAPEFSQLHGENAALVYQVYAGESGKQYSSKEEEAYFKKVTHEKKIVNKESKRQEAARQSRIRKSLSGEGRENDG